MRREKLSSGYYRINLQGTSQRQQDAVVSEVFKRAFSVPADDLIESVIINTVSRGEASNDQNANPSS
jgi:hypothetical protein